MKWSNSDRAKVQGELMESKFEEVKRLADAVNLPMHGIKNHAMLVKALIERYEHLLVSADEALRKIQEIKEA